MTLFNLHALLQGCLEGQQEVMTSPHANGHALQIRSQSKGSRVNTSRPQRLLPLLPQVRNDIVETSHSEALASEMPIAVAARTSLG